MKSIGIFLLYGCSLLMFIGCGKSDVVEPQTVEPGKLKLTLIRGLSKTPTSLGMNGNLSLVENVSYDLGDLRSSADFYFVISNVGGTTVKNISLRSNDSSFVVFPQSIDSLIPGTTVDLRNLSDLPLVRVTTVHGPALHGIGFARLMQQGSNEGWLRIRGETRVGGGVVLSDSLIVRLRVNALVMSVTLHDSTREIDLSRPNGSVLLGGFLNSQFVNLYYVYDTVKITNNGNVPILMALYTPIYNIDTLAVGQTLVLGDRPSFYVSFFAWNTVADPARFRFYPDGRAYIRLWRN